jgi:hypothetical protein
LCSHRLHKIASEAVPIWCIDVKHAYTGVEAESSSSSEPGLRFENAIKVV